MRSALLIGLLSCLGCTTALEADSSRQTVPGETVTDATMRGGETRVIVASFEAGAMVSFRAWTSGPLVGATATLLGPSGVATWAGTTRGTSLRMDGVRTAEAGPHRMVLTWTAGEGVASYRFDVLSTAPEPFRVDRLLDLTIDQAPAPRAGAAVVSTTGLDGTAQRILVAGGYSAGTVSRGGTLAIGGEAVLVDPTTGQNQIVGGLATGRAFAAAVALPDGTSDFAGKILVAGGLGPNGAALASTELFDRETQAFVPGPTLPEERAFQSVLPIDGTGSFLDGKVVLVGGERTRAIPQNDKDTGLYAEVDENPKDVWYFDPTTGAFQRFAVLDEGRVGVVPALLSDGRLFFIGGGVDTVPSARGCEERVDNACRCNPGGVIPLCTEFRDCVDGVCAYTNYTRKDVATRRIEIYDTATGTHKVLPQSSWLSRGRVGHSVLVLSGDRIIVAGGATAWSRSFQATEFGSAESPKIIDSVEIFEPENNAFRVLPPLALSREGGRVADLGAAGLLIFGGTTPTPEGGARTGLVERYLPKEDRFEAVGNLSVARAGAAVVKIWDKDAVLLIGGEEAGGPTAAIELVTARAVGPAGSDADTTDTGDATDSDSDAPDTDTDGDGSEADAP